MASVDIQLPEVAEGSQDHLALAHEFKQLSADLLRSNELERKQNSAELNEEELAFLASIPDKMRRACDITRILRRTNTGPAKVKEKTPRASRAKMAQSEINKLLDD